MVAFAEALAARYDGPERREDTAQAVKSMRVGALVLARAGIPSPRVDWLATDPGEVHVTPVPMAGPAAETRPSLALGSWRLARQLRRSRAQAGQPRRPD